MNLSSRSRALLTAASLCATALPALAAADVPSIKPTLHQDARAQLKLAFSAVREFRPRGDRYDYQIGRLDAENAMRSADAVASSKTERLLANDIHTYFAERDACRLAPTVSEYGTCEARVSDRLGDKIIATLDGSAAR